MERGLSQLTVAERGLKMPELRSEDYSIERLFQQFYVVPDYQREYVWEDKHVEAFIGDIHEEFFSSEDKQTDYFIGSIIVCPHEGADTETLEVIDGQQRITTAYIALCAIRDHHADIASNPGIAGLDGQIGAGAVDDLGKDFFEYRVVLQYADSEDVLRQIASRVDGGLEDIQETTASITNLVNAYRNIRAFLNRKFEHDENGLRKFYAYFTKYVKLVLVRTENLADALKVFETINDRGLGLNAMDLLKNRMFIEANESQYETLKERWKELVEILEKANEKPLRFLRYFVMSRYETKGVIREDDIHTWFLENKRKCKYADDPPAYVDLLLDNAKAYVNFVQGRDIQGNDNRYLANIRRLSGQARQHLILLLAGQKLKSGAFTELCKEIENLFFSLLVLGEPTRDLERLFADWTDKLRKIAKRKALDEFLEGTIRPQLQLRAGRLKSDFTVLTEDSQPQYRVKYILAKLTQYVDEQAYGSESSAASLLTYIAKDVHMEHILPKNPTETVRQQFDDQEKYDSWVGRLGNLACLEKTINESVANASFRKKQSGYNGSKFLLTQCLGDKPVVGKKTAVNRAVKEIPEFSKWTSRSIEKRQKFLSELALKTWGIPEVH